MQEMDNLLNQSRLLPAPAWEVNCHLNQRLVKLQEFGTKQACSLLLPPFDVKRSQKTMSNLNIKFPRCAGESEDKKEILFKKEDCLGSSHGS